MRFWFALSAVLLVFLSGTPVFLSGGPAAAAPAPSPAPVDYVIIAGVAGLRWEDIDAQNTPTLWAMAERGSIGSLSVRSAQQPTCPLDGWVTLGAGNRAAWVTSTPSRTPPPVCARRDVTVERPDGIGAYLPEVRQVVRYNQEQMPYGAVPGALAESVRCTVAVGTGAAVAAARPFGRVDRYEPALPAQPQDLLDDCRLGIVDLGTVAAQDATLREAEARRADRALAAVLAARPADSLVIVAGLSDTDRVNRLHVAIADGPGWEGDWLTSASTGRDGYLQLVDLAPTALAALGRELPQRVFGGQPARTVPGRPAELDVAVTQPADADREAGAQRDVATWFFGLLAGLQLLLAILVVPLLRRARGHIGPHGPRPAPRGLVAAVEVLLVAAALAIPAALVADAVPWWRSDHAGLLFAAVTLAVLAAGTAAIRYSPRYRATLGPLAMVAAVAAIVVAADVITGARLQLNGVAGYSALTGNRYAGLGRVGLGVFLAGTLLVSGCLAQQVRRAWRPVVFGTVGGAGILLVGSPYLGADAVGAIALTAGVCIAAAISTGGWLTFARLAWATLAGLFVTAGFALFDLSRPDAERDRLGRFITALGDGTGGRAVQRAAASSVGALDDSPLTVLAVVGVVLVWFALLRPWGGLKRLLGLYPAIRAAMVGITTAAMIGGVLGGSGLDVAGAVAALTVPMATLAALRVLDHASDRTLPPLDPDQLPSPPVPPTPAAPAPAVPAPPAPAVPAPAVPARADAEVQLTDAASAPAEVTPADAAVTPAEPLPAPSASVSGPAASAPTPAPAPEAPSPSIKG
ncbi:hypothetical protein [Phytohabitans aurantiacus]|uniref:Uncharacterized protein n=1 Tax=Phytohabitans aurantiacus TaxID=3016789 RepID=A0ABQ5RA74_9ACTN|nr:hypothetical protein [Phytohabitans aurantiacus]GLI03662.1 hypothetical protein Pa4123_89410 [Phytohabitans aurantiacus]